MRELKRVAEQSSLLSPLPFIRKCDVLALLRPTVEGAHTLRADLSQGLAKLIENYERQILSEALKQTSNIDDAARALQISRSSLYKKIKDLGIEIND